MPSVARGEISMLDLMKIGFIRYIAIAVIVLAIIANSFVLHLVSLEKTEICRSPKNKCSGGMVMPKAAFLTLSCF